MKLMLERLEALELQGIMRDALSVQNNLEALQVFDSSRMELICQINHGLMKLEQLMKGNKFDQDLKKLIEVTVEELCVVKSEFDINEAIVPLLCNCSINEIEKLNALVVHCRNEFSETYITNIQKRIDAIKTILVKVGDING